jgi:hypothetical protein
MDLDDYFSGSKNKVSMEIDLSKLKYIINIIILISKYQSNWKFLLEKNKL